MQSTTARPGSAGGRTKNRGTCKAFLLKTTKTTSRICGKPHNRKLGNPSITIRRNTAWGGPTKIQIANQETVNSSSTSTSTLGSRFKPTKNQHLTKRCQLWEVTIPAATDPKRNFDVATGAAGSSYSTCLERYSDYRNPLASQSQPELGHLPQKYAHLSAKPAIAS
jgi:hypothetical protein